MDKLTKNQKRILDLLLNRYESSKTYRGENKRNQTFRVKVEEIWPAYLDNFTDIAEIEEFERETEVLEQENLISIHRKKSGELQCFSAIAEKIPAYYTLLNREEKKETDLNERQMYEAFTERDDALGAFCRDQLTLLAKGRSARYRKDRANNYLLLMEHILDNREELFERELSVEVLHDTKLFEQSYRKTVCEILRKYGEYADLPEDETEERLRQMLILESHQIYTNPGYVYVKGRAKIVFRDGNEMELPEGLPMAFSSSTIHAIARIETESKRILTIENMTTFHRFAEEDFFCIYLAGYHSRLKTDFLKKIAPANQKQWFHFGDLDPDGFLILKNLRIKTALNFLPYHMEKELLAQYEAVTKPLEENDRRKAENLMASGFYADTLEEMLKTGRKLEQEAVINPSGKDLLCKPYLPHHPARCHSGSR